MWFAAKQLENVSRCDFIRDVGAYSDHSHCDMVNFGGSCWHEGCPAWRRRAESRMHQNWSRFASASGLSCPLWMPRPCHWWQALSGKCWPACLVCLWPCWSALPLALLSAVEASDSFWAWQHIAAPRPANSSQGLSALQGSALLHRVHC